MPESTGYSNLTVSKLAKIIGATLPKGFDGSTKCARVLTQSMYVQPGDVVISAGWYPHSQIIPESLEKGAAVIFCDRETKKAYPQERVLPVDDPKECVFRFEKWRAKPCKAKRIAITGSVGKTTTTGLINAVIANSFPALTHHTMSNSHGAILRNVQHLEPSHKYWIQEVGGVQPGYVESSARFLCPDIVVLTNIGESHLNLYGTKQNIFHDKSSLERYAQPGGVVIINYDDEILRNAEYTHKVVTCSKSDSHADYYAENIRTEQDGTHFTAVCPDGRCEIYLKLYGEHNVYNALSAVAVGRLAGVPLDKIAELLATYEPSGMRQNLVRVGGYSFFVDTFNAEPKTVLGAAETLMQIPVSEKGRRIFVTGHIDKIGEASPQMHEALGHDLAKLKLDKVALFAGDSRYTYKAMVEDGCTNVFHSSSREEMDNWLRENITRDDIVFFKSGQFEAAMAKSIDHVFGTAFQNEQQFNEGRIVERDGFRFKLRQDHIAELCGYTGDKTELVIPATYDEWQVIRIAPFAFTKNYELKSVVIPDAVVNIGQEAFYICPKLEKVKLPASLKIIGKNAFNYCRALKSVEIPSGTIHIDRRAFYDCVSLESVSVPESVGFLGVEVFGAGKPEQQKKLRISCAPGSLAEAYAKENGLSLSLLSVSHAAPRRMVRPEDKKLIDRSNYWKKSYKERTSGKNILSKAQKEEVRSFWGRYQELFDIDTVFHSFYLERTGCFDVRYMPVDMYYCFVDPFYNNWDMAPTIDNKCLYPQLFKNTRQPDTLFCRVNNIWTDTDMQLIPEKDILEIVSQSDELVVKQANDSEGGSNIFFISGDGKLEQFKKACGAIKKDIVVQKPIRQHKDISAINPASINTIRVLSLLRQDEVKICSAILRMDVNGAGATSSAKGSIACGIEPDGRLKSLAYNFKGEAFRLHPTTGLEFDSMVIPGFDKVLRLVKDAHPYIPHFRLVSWDVAVDISRTPLLVEANLSYGELNLHQLCNGPIFGDSTQEILNEVFSKK